jgi:hypothetical protein
MGATRALRVLLVLLLMLPVALIAPVAVAEEEPVEVYDMVFPLIGDNHYTDTFSAPRSGERTHEGTDIVADKMIPVVAAASGNVRWIGNTCCYFALRHDDGWESWYIHLNNDTPGTDDGNGWGLAPGIVPGARVEAGELVGWVGDSGNAEWTVSHLHFDLRTPDGTAINSDPHLLQATVLDAPGYNGFFVDDEGSAHESAINRIAEAGITKGCNPPLNTKYCPARTLTRGEMTAFLRRVLELPNVEEDYFTDDSGSTFHNDINALAAAGIAFGCTETEYCAGAPLTRAEMAELLVRAFGFESAEPVDVFGDDDGHRFEAAINRIAAAAITRGCNPPDNTDYCPDRPLVRSEMATFFVRALDL